MIHIGLGFIDLIVARLGSHNILLLGLKPGTPITVEYGDQALAFPLTVNAQQHSATTCAHAIGHKITMFAGIENLTQTLGDDQIGYAGTRSPSLQDAVMSPKFPGRPPCLSANRRGRLSGSEYRRHALGSGEDVSLVSVDVDGDLAAGLGQKNAGDARLDFHLLAVRPGNRKHHQGGTAERPRPEDGEMYRR